MSDRDGQGRFTVGNKARRRRQRVLSTQDLCGLVDKQLAIRDDARPLDEVLGGLVADLVAAAVGGDHAATRWLVDRFCPPEKAPRARLGRLPQPSAEPLKFLDAIAGAVATGKIAIDDAAKLSRLAAPVIADRQLADALEQLRVLAEKVRELEASGPLRVVR